MALSEFRVKGADEAPPVEAATVEVPASSANLGPGFDALALALELRLRVTMRWVPLKDGQGSWPPTLTAVVATGEGAERIERGPQNRVWQAALRLFRLVAPPAWTKHWGIEVEEANSIPLAAGLGSSAAAAVAGLWAANALVGSPVPYRRLLDLAAGMEGHADNAAAAALGGFVACRVEADGSVTAVRVPVPRGELAAAVAVPHFALPTEHARRVLPETVTLRDAVFNVGGSALVVGALTTGRFELLRVAMADRLHQPYRLGLVPGLEAAMQAAVEAGAYGAALSGAGPSVLALCKPHEAEAVGAAMARAFSSHGQAARWLVLEPASEGARLRTRRPSESHEPSVEERESM